MRLLTLIMAVGLSGCAATLSPVRADSELRGCVLVRLKQIDGKIVKLLVVNESPYLLVVDRDRITLSSAAGERSRVPGGLAGTYTIPPGGGHDVNLKFDLGGLTPGSAELRFTQAILINGTPLDVPPLTFKVD
jgi:hypothetical protein